MNMNYDLVMFQKYQKMIQNDEVRIQGDENLTSILFMQNFAVQFLKLERCENLVPVFSSSRLKRMTISKCKIQTIEGLNGNNVEQVNFSCNLLNDIKSIAKYQQLKILDLSFNQGIDITPIYNTRVTELNLSNCQISNIQQLPLTLNILNLSNNECEDISSLINNTNLRILMLTNNKIRDVSCISNLINLEELDLSFNQISDVDPLQNLNIMRLNLQNCQITQIPALQSLTKLFELNLSGNANINIQPLQNLIRLTKLQLNNINLKSVSKLKALVNLQELELTGNNNLQITHVKNFKLLQVLLLDECSLADLRPLRELSALKRLNLSSNNIAFLYPLKELHNLYELNLKYNRINSFANLSKHPNFGYYDISFQTRSNQIIDNEQYIIKLNIYLDNIIQIINEWRIKQIKHSESANEKCTRLSGWCPQQFREYSEYSGQSLTIYFKFDRLIAMTFQSEIIYYSQLLILYLLAQIIQHQYVIKILCRQIKKYKISLNKYTQKQIIIFFTHNVPNYQINQTHILYSPSIKSNISETSTFSVYFVPFPNMKTVQAPILRFVTSGVEERVFRMSQTRLSLIPVDAATCSTVDWPVKSIQFTIYRVLASALFIIVVHRLVKQQLVSNYYSLLRNTGKINTTIIFPTFLLYSTSNESLRQNRI
ncbi:Conserved_hypothetical protein [Hexamita inflata]|uniref:Uncharacterized protein n=1 Tax=Hexamita inflata TaxID=28002 RepID=A0AA86NZV6_9EUKA|nr:Conserved hypothetical protein [Hexamita inflata]